jgi:hypothetical protein
MTDPERQHIMDFIINRQLRLESDFEVSRLELKQLRRILLSLIRLARRERSEIRDKFAALTNAQIRSEEALKVLELKTTAKLSALADAQIRTEQHIAAFQAQTTERINALEQSTAAFQIQTTERINALEQSTAAFQSQTIERINALQAFQEQLAASQSQVSQALFNLSEAMIQTNKRIDRLEDTSGDGHGGD